MNQFYRYYSPMNAVHQGFALGDAIDKSALNDQERPRTMQPYFMEQGMRAAPIQNAFAWFMNPSAGGFSRFGR
jgi:hypothetical protein